MIATARNIVPLRFRFVSLTIAEEWRALRDACLCLAKIEYCQGYLSTPKKTTNVHTMCIKENRVK